MTFVHLGLKSEYSFLSSISTVSDLVEAAQNHHMSTMALCDIETMAGHVEFYTACIEKGITPLLGVTLFVRESYDIAPYIFIAKNNTGYEELLRLITYTQDEKYVDITTYADTLKNVYMIGQGQHSRIVKYILAKEEQEALDLYTQYNTVCAGMYIGISNYGRMEDDFYFERLDSTIRKHDLKAMYVHDVRMVRSEDDIHVKALLALKENTDITEIGRTYQDLSMMTFGAYEHLDTRYAQYLEATLEFATLCEVTLDFTSYHLPRYQKTSEPSERYLRALSYKGLEKRLNRTLTLEEEERLDTELRIIEEMGFSDYFLVVFDIIRYAKTHDIVVGPGRGSAAGSLVAYALYITEIHPLEYTLLFDRFLNKERISMPDIDIDFEDDGRDEIIAYIKQTYGFENAAQISTFGTFAKRSAFRDMARVYKTPLPIVNTVAKTLRSSKRLSEDLQENYQLKKMMYEYNLVDVMETAMRVEGLKRHYSVHAAGVVITKESLSKWTSLTKEKHTMLEAKDLEKLGLLKIDILGLRNLTLLKLMYQLAFDDTYYNVLAKLSNEDQDTFEGFYKQSTLGIFQLESDGITRLIRQVKPKTIADVAAVLALYRPGPMEYIPSFIARRFDKEAPVPIHDRIAFITNETYGIPIYQEQIMQIANHVAQFSLSKADILRRAMGKKDVETLQSLQFEFQEGAIQNGYTKEEAKELFDRIIPFANYGFNKSHAVSYAVIAYRLMYMKVHHPLAFYSALLIQNRGSVEKQREIVQELTKQKIELLPIDIFLSDEGFTIEDHALRMGFTSLHHMNERTAKKIVEAMREKKERIEKSEEPLRFIFEVLHELEVEETVIQNLIYVDAFASIEPNQKYVDAYYDTLKNVGFGSFLKVTLAFEHTDNYDYLTRAAHELEALSFNVKYQKTKHMYEQLKTYIPKLSSVDSLRKTDIDTRVFLVGEIVSYRFIRTKKGEEMMFMTIKDSFRQLRMTLFPRTTKTYGAFLHTRDLEKQVVYIEGMLRFHEDHIQCTVEHIEKAKDKLNVLREKTNIE